VTDLGFVHRWVPPSTIDVPTLLLLHGTGGDEEDLIGLGMVLMPGAALLSPRGKTVEAGNPRWFRRLRPGVFDEEDLAARTAELADFVAGAAAAYDFDPARVVAVGFSNGANIAASLLLTRPGLLAGAVLFRAQVPYESKAKDGGTAGQQSGTDARPAGPVSPSPRPTVPRIFLTAGDDDPMVPPDNAERLAAQLRAAGAEVTVHWVPGGHALTTPEVDAARQWLAGTPV
jgi:predicted esterase